MTRRVRASACLLASLFAGVGHAWAQERPLTTKELVQRALEHNRDLLSERERVAEAQGLVRRAGVRHAPTVEIEAGTGRPLGTHGEEEYSASYFQPIETAGKRAKRVAVSQYAVTLAEAEFADRALQLVFDVKTRIAELHAARMKSDAIARLLRTSRESYKLTQARVAEGDAAVLEEHLLLTEVSRIDAQRATLNGRAATAVLDLERLVGSDISQSVDVVDELAIDADLSLEDLKTRAAKARPDLMVARAEEAQASAELVLARAEGVPDLTASAKYTRRSSQFEGLYAFGPANALSPLQDRDHILTLSLSIPVFTSNRNRGDVEAATARVTGARLHREHLEATIPQEVESGYVRWAAAKETLRLFQHGVIDQSERNLEVIRQAYTLGQMRLLDVLTEQRRLVDTELAYIDAQTELAEAAADLERVVGEELP